MLEEILDIAREASRLVMTHYRKDDLEVRLKDDSSPLTAADLQSHTFILERLSQCSDAPIISEEAPIPYEKRRDWGRFWLVDPLDGTKDFIAATDEFTINIALIEKHIPVMGVVAVPALGLLYYGAAGRGAFKETKDGTIQIFNSRKGEDLICAESRFHASENTKAFCQRNGIRKVCCFGSAMKLCKIGEGQIDIYPRYKPTMEWDTAAGHAILKESGGKLIDMITKSELLYNKESLRNNGFIASRLDLDLE